MSVSSHNRSPTNVVMSGEMLVGIAWLIVYGLIAFAGVYGKPAQLIAKNHVLRGHSAGKVIFQRPR